MVDWLDNMWHRVQGCPHLGTATCCSPVGKGEAWVLLDWLFSWVCLNPTTYVAQGSGLPWCGRWYLLQPCKSCGWVFLLSQGLKGRFEGFGGDRQIPLQAGRILIIILIEDKVECRVGVWVAPKFEGESRQSGVKHVCSLWGSDCNCTMSY